MAWCVTSKGVAWCVILASVLDGVNGITSVERVYWYEIDRSIDR